MFDRLDDVKKKSPITRKAKEKLKKMKKKKN